MNRPEVPPPLLEEESTQRIPQEPEIIHPHVQPTGAGQQVPSPLPEEKNTQQIPQEPEVIHLRVQPAGAGTQYSVPSQPPVDEEFQLQVVPQHQAETLRGSPRGLRRQVLD